MVAEVEGVVDVGIPDRARRVDAVLDPALAQAGDGAAQRAVHLQGEELVAIDADGPGRVDLRDDAAFEFEGAVGGVVGGALVAACPARPRARGWRGAEAADGAHAAEEVVEHVAPVAEHVDDDAAVVLLAVVPGGALRGLPVAFEDPVAELAAHGEDAAEEAAVDQALELAQAGQKELVLHDAVLHACGGGVSGKAQGGGKRVGERLFAVDVLAGGDGSFDAGSAQAGELRVEVDGVVRIGERGVEVGGPARDVVLSGDLLELGGVAADQDRIGHQTRAVG